MNSIDKPCRKTLVTGEFEPNSIPPEDSTCASSVICKEECIEKTADKAITEAINKIVIGTSGLNFGFDIKDRLHEGLSGDCNNAPYELKKVIDDIYNELTNPSPEQASILDEYYRANHEMSNAKRAVKLADLQERTRVSDIHYISIDLKNQEEMLAKMPNPKPPNNFLTRLLDTKRKQTQRMNYARLHDIFTAMSQSAEQMKDNLKSLRKTRDTNIKYIRGHKKSLAEITQKSNSVLAKLDSASKTGDALRKASGDVIVELSKKLNVQDPFSHGTITWDPR